MRIRVQPDQLRQVVVQLRHAADDLRGVQRYLGGAFYRLDWLTRLQTAVEGQVNAARRQAGGLADHADSMARFLEARALGFEDADRQGAISLSRIPAPKRTPLSWLSPPPHWARLQIAFPILFVPDVLGWLGRQLKVTFANLREPAPTWLQLAKPPGQPPGQRDQVKAPEAPIQTVPEPSKDFRVIAERVPSGEYNDSRYYRGPKDKSPSLGSYKSNCTWFCAAAVKEASEGRIDLDGFKSSLGNGGQWAERAKAALNESDPRHELYKDYARVLESVDRTPQAGSVWCMPIGSLGHVAFVERVEEKLDSNGKKTWAITLSEEDYYGKPLSRTSKAVFAGEDVRRWTRTVEVEADEHGNFPEKRGEFIHFKL